LTTRFYSLRRGDHSSRGVLLIVVLCKEPQYTVDRLRTPYGRPEEEKLFLILLAFEPQFFGIPVRSLVTMPRGVKNKKN